MSQRRIAVLDACVLYPAPLRDLLMWLAITGSFQAKWSHAIQHEWSRHLLRNRPDLTPEQVQRTMQRMDRALPDALVDGYEALPSALMLPDPGDAHVVAAAVACGADAIVTFNLKDFPAQSLACFGIEAVHPDDFVLELFDRSADTVIDALRRQRNGLTSPPVDAERLLDLLAAVGLPHTVAALRPVTHLI